MDRLLAYQNAGLEPPLIFLGSRPDGPQDLLDEPMQLSLADKAKLGIQLDADEDNREHMQWELRMALEKIRSSAGHSLPIGGVSGSESKPFDGMDPVSSALLMELAASVMPEKPQPIVCEARYTPQQRRASIARWMAKRARRHLTSQTKYRKMKDVAVNKARCKGGKFIKKSERERLAREAAAAAAAVAAMEPVQIEPVLGKFDAVFTTAASIKPQFGADSEWQRHYSFFAQSEE